MDEISDAELENSLVILKQTIANLNEKLEFLIEQKSLYTDLQNDLLEYVPQKDDTTNNTTDDKKSLPGKNGKIIGELIISSTQIFKNIGYEYYEEIERDECIEFVETKIKMIEKAIDQFELKIKECEDVLKDFDSFAKINTDDSLEKNITMETLQFENQPLDSMDTNFPVMDIREELDENGNVLSSSVKPVNSNNNIETNNVVDKHDKNNDTKIDREKTTSTNNNYKNNNNYNKDNHNKDNHNKDNHKKNNNKNKNNNHNAYKDFPKTNIMEIREELDADGNVIKSDVFSANDQLMNSKNNEKSFQTQTKDSLQKNKSNILKNNDLHENEEFYELLEDMGIIENKTEYLNEKYNPSKDNSFLEKEPQIVEIIEENDLPVDGIKETIEERGKEEILEKIDEEEEILEKINEEEEMPIVQDIKEVDLEDIKILGKASSNKEYLKYTDPSKPAIDPKDLYTLEDIINKMDLTSLESEEEHDEDIDENIKDGFSNDNTLPHLDYERFNKYFQDHDNTDESDSEASWEKHSDIEYSVVPGLAASNAFQGQILKLRQQKLQSKDSKEIQKPIISKSILKKAVASTDDVIVNAQPSKGKKKSVGFAKDLDVVVVENMKDETRKNTFGMADYYSMSFSGLDYDDHSEDLETSYNYPLDTKAESTDEALSNLLKLPVDETSNEVGIVENTDANPQEIQPSKPKLSKFKQNRLKKNKSKRNSMMMENDFSLDDGLGIQDNNSNASNSSGSKNMIANFLETLESASSKLDSVTVEQDGTQERDKDAESFGVTADIVERTPVEAGEIKSTPTISEREKMKVFGKSFNSLSKPSFQEKEAIRDNESTTSDEEQANDYQTSESDLEKPLDLDALKTAENSGLSSFQKDSISKDFENTADKNRHEKDKAYVIQDEKLQVIENPKIDYSQLNTMDELAQAYLMGLYDDDVVPQVGPYEAARDIGEGPGFVVEKLDDFKDYNKTVEILKDEIDEFLLERNNNDEIDEDENDQLYKDAEESDNHAVMTDIVERADLEEEEDCDVDDYPLQDHMLHEQIAKDYYTQRQKIIANQRSFEQFNPNDQSKEYEPIDEHGNPVKTSRFRSSRINTQSTKF